MVSQDIIGISHEFQVPLEEHLIKCGFMVVLVSPFSTVKNRQLMNGRWDKHDTKDAGNVADLIALGKCLYYDYPEAAIRDIRNLLSFKKRLKKEEQTLQQGTLLRQSGHPMGDERHGGSTLPSLTTIGCILWQRELTHRRTGRYTPKGKKYRELPALLPNQTHQVDMVALVILPARSSSSACMPSIPQSTGAG